MVGGIPPTLDCLRGDPQEAQLDEFVEQIFKYDSNSYWSRDLRRILVASLLRYYDDLYLAIQREPSGKFHNPIRHPFMAELQVRLKDAEVSPQTLSQWKFKVKERYLADNYNAVPTHCFEHLRGTPE